MQLLRLLLALLAAAAAAKQHTFHVKHAGRLWQWGGLRIHDAMGAGRDGAREEKVRATASFTKASVTLTRPPA